MRDVWAEFGVTSQPAWAFINDDGPIDVHKGSLGETRLNERIDALIAS